MRDASAGDASLSEHIPPNVFISYCWTTPSHEQWVETLARELVALGIHPVFDKWDLREGEDATTYMERMVNDPTINKVILVCDKAYKEKADARHGGAGTEAQIIGPLLYRSLKNTKFCAIIVEKDYDGNGYIPTYYSSRIYIDLSDETDRTMRIEQLTRWIYDKPLHVRPEQGKRPAFLDEDTSGLQLNTSPLGRRALDAIRNHRPFWQSALKNYLEALASGFEKLRLPHQPEYERAVLESLTNFLPARNQFIDVCNTCARQDFESECGWMIHRFFETLLQYYGPPKTIGTWQDHEADNYKFFIYELFVYAVAAALKEERFVLASALLQQDYFGPAAGFGSQKGMNPFTVFGSHHPEVFNTLNLHGQPKHSYRAHIFHERSSESGFEFRELMQADLLMTLAATSRSQETLCPWWPDTLLYLPMLEMFPLFARCRSKSYYARVEPAIGLTSTQVMEFVTTIDGAGGLFRGSRGSTSLKRFLDIDNFCSRP